jgi:hypothetical protein
MNQASLFHQATNARTGLTRTLPAHPARHADPLISHRAATRVRRAGTIGQQHRLVLDLLAKWNAPMTARELATRHDVLDVAFYHVIQRRLKELAPADPDTNPHGLGYVQDAGLDADGRARTWVISRKGRDALRGAV